MADPIGGMIIALAVIAGWGAITWEHVTKLMGRHAAEELVRRVEAIADAHHPLLKRDALRCYHAGEGVLVELEAGPISRVGGFYHLVTYSHTIKVLLDVPLLLYPFCSYCV